MAPGDVRILLEKAQENTLTLRDRLKRIDKLLSQVFSDIFINISHLNFLL